MSMHMYIYSCVYILIYLRVVGEKLAGSSLVRQSGGSCGTSERDCWSLST